MKAITREEFFELFKPEQEQDEYLTATAVTHLEVHVKCPRCNNFQDIFDRVSEDLDSDFRATDICKQIRCEKCKKDFYVTEITF